MPNFGLIVDDKPEFLVTFADKYGPWFRRRGLELVTKSSADDARRFIRKHGKSIEFAAVDILLPRPQIAIRLLMYITEHYSGIKRIAITAQADRDTIGSMVARRLIDGYVDKVWKERRILQEFRRVLENPCDPMAHTRITEAVRQWVRHHPEMRDQHLTMLDNKKYTMADIVREIEAGTEFGKRQERLILQMAFDQWVEERPSHRAAKQQGTK